MREGPLTPSRVGVLLLDSHFRPVHFNAEAARILRYPKSMGGIPPLESVLAIEPAELTNARDTASPSPRGFTSGRRQYRCRAFVLDARERGEPRLASMVLMLERDTTALGDLPHQWSARYQLTMRERETVEYLLRGLTSKEIASEMHISASTVKTFLKLVMVKVGASNRAGLITKLLNRASCLAIAIMPNPSDLCSFDLTYLL